jgi:formate hydrogenlyase subunit 6/NADH:ubiquinone oxidoreductase subunit I
MAIDETDLQTAPTRTTGVGIGLVKGLGVTLKHALRRSVTQRYPDVKPDLAPRTRGVIALKEANCTVCYKCSRECPDWCIYIDAHKESHEPASGGKARSVKVLDRFAIDYALCMYCGICVEACPFDALFWSPEFEYSTSDIDLLTHEKDKLEEWTYTVLPPPELEVGAEVVAVPDAASVAAAAGPAQAPAAASVVPEVRTAGDSPPSAAAATGTAGGPAPSVAPAGAGAAAAAAATETTPENATPSVAAAGEVSVAPSTVAGDHGERVEASAPAAAAPAESHAEVVPDQEVFDRVLAEQLAAGKDRRVAEGQARRAAMIAARKKAEG